MRVNLVALFSIVPLLSLATLTYTPDNLNPKTAAVVVVIHGCLQSPDAMALGTGWNEIADKNNLVILYPKVPTGTNDLGCWSWYLDDNQTANGGELKLIKQQIETTIKHLKLSKPRVFVTGISSGGATTAGLLACFPNFFTAGAVHSGPSYGLAKNITQAQTILKNGPKDTKTAGPCSPSKNTSHVMVIQGLDDKVVHPAHAQRIIDDFIGAKEPQKTEDHESGSLKYHVKLYETKGIQGRLVTIDGLGHAWAGFGTHMHKSELVGPKGKFPTTIPFFTEQGPSSTQLIWDFFNQSKP